MRRHGKRVVEILNDIDSDPSLAERITPAAPFIYADLLFCARSEMVVQLDDLLRRRLPLLILARLNEPDLRRIVLRISGVMGWDDSKAEREIAACSHYTKP